MQSEEKNYIFVKCQKFKQNVRRRNTLTSTHYEGLK